jgi:ferric-dicitrate binding protein FerR (iron transport regulator)
MSSQDFEKIMTISSDKTADQEIQDLIVQNFRRSEDIRLMQDICKLSSDSFIFSRISAQDDWELIRTRLGLSSSRDYRKIAWPAYFIRIAALILLVFGLSYGLFKLMNRSKESLTGFSSFISGNHCKEITLPDGSEVALNAGSKLIYRNDFGQSGRDVILEGEAFFHVVYDSSRHFRVFVDHTVVDVTGTKFSIREENGQVKVSVFSGSVLFAAEEESKAKVRLEANHSALFLPNSESILVKEGIPPNMISWKTGALLFEETPIDSALQDIAWHFRKELIFESNTSETITAEFKNQSLVDILSELKLVAGLRIDTTSSALIVRR